MAFWANYGMPIGLLAIRFFARPFVLATKAHAEVALSSGSHASTASASSQLSNFFALANASTQQSASTLIVTPWHETHL